MAKITRFNIENYCHFVTAKTRRNAKVFLQEEAASLLVQTILKIKEKLDFKLLAFVAMPDHVHLILMPDKRNTISDVMRHIKGRFSRKYNLLSRGMNSPDYGAPNHGTGNLSLPKPKVWQESFHDHVIRNRKEFDQRLNYLYNNPVKAKLVEKPEDYEYSSASGKYEIDLNGYAGG
jgi:putative transposase